MDWLNDMRVLVTLSSFAAFVGVVLWAYAPALRSRFDADAAIPFLDDDGLLSEKAGARQAIECDHFHMPPVMNSGVTFLRTN